MELRALRGMNDILPEEVERWHKLEGAFRLHAELHGYAEVRTPQLVDRKLWEASGHWEKFRENMYLSENEAGLQEFVADPAQRIFALKPMRQRWLKARHTAVAPSEARVMPSAVRTVSTL